MTTLGQPLEIIFPGQYNQNQGPDFSGAKIRIGNTIWAGNIEIHTYSSDWNSHHHSDDANYNNIILHVVWLHDIEIMDMNSHVLPALELESRVSKILLNKYEELMNASSFIACEKQIPSINELVLSKWQERLVVERLERRSLLIFKFLNENNFHWEQTFWWLIARNFGITVNSDCFEKIARSIPLPILAKHKNQIHQLEAILFGQASLLDQKFIESYPKMLQKEYKFYRLKYGLQKIPLQLFFLRMRPANFPSLRLAQLAMLISESNHLFSKIKEEDSVKQIIKMLDVTPNDYWHYHYRFDEIGTFRMKNMGKQMICNILINTIVPALYAYGSHHKEEKYKEKALEWLTQITAEKNAITKGFEKFQVRNRTAFASQALIELKTQYCDPKRCLECAIGNAIIKVNHVPNHK
jgi:hypothetical protein